ncbi:MAG: YigZ family protein [Ignavibacteriales bacterium]|nr:YigZ family protein [Ignavibacteriales bacterium]
MAEKIQSYTTIKSKSESKYKEKGSIFLAFAHPINSISEFDEILHGYRKQFYDAVHHCSAYKLIDGSFKYSDDGEPGGTAGLRIFNAIEHSGLNNCAVIVVRYFGGVKLGTGPLGKAYYETAIEALTNSDKIQLHRFERYHFSAPYELSSFLYRHLTNDHVKINGSDYASGISLDTFIKSDYTAKILEEILAGANGQVEIVNVKEERYFEYLSDLRNLSD